MGRIRGGLFDLSFDVWLKRFNSKGTLDFLLKKAFGSRAKRLWKVNLKLFEKGLPVPVPFAYYEPSFKMKHSFYLSSVIENSENLGVLYKEGRFHSPEDIAQMLGQAIAQWHLAGAVHGDMKWSNILLQANGEKGKVFFIDLDQAKLYRRPNIRGMCKDLKRFYRFGLEIGAEEWVCSCFFPAYLASIPDQMRARIDVEHVKKTAAREWNKRGQRRF
ncbi:MAG: lipopolysaccharide kinase InaA family protein [Nitrospirota bacterium]